MHDPTILPVSPGSIVHFVGIGGSGMSSLAVVLRDAGFVVRGTDVSPSGTIDMLRANGISTVIGHDAINIEGAGVVVRSAAVPLSNPEIVAATAQGIPVFTHAEVLGSLSKARRTLAVAGTHGKTTTTAMLASILVEAGLDPTILVGGVMPDLGSGARLGASPFLVVEADEYDRRFLQLHPEIAIVTNLEPDHLDYYGNLGAIIEAFESFVNRVREDGWIIVGADSPLGAKLADLHPDRSPTYGLGPLAEWRAVGISRNDLGGNDFYVFAHETLVGQFRLRVPGEHNVSNALAAAVAAGRIGVDFTVASRALAKFSGVQRRLEYKGEVRGVVLYDDYAHHPTEVRATLSAAREQASGRIVCLFQPHTFHRLRTLFSDFTLAFKEADLVVIADVYAPTGRGPSDGDLTSEKLAASIVGTNAQYGGSLDESITLLAQLARSGDVVLTMGAGDVTKAGPWLLRALADREA